MRRKVDIDVELALKLRKRMTWEELGEFFGCTGDTVHARIDPHYGTKRKADINIARNIRDADLPKKQRAAPVPGAGYVTSRVNEADAAARLAEIPHDTRDFTARFFGDPIPKDPRRYGRA